MSKNHVNEQWLKDRGLVWSEKDKAYIPDNRPTTITAGNKTVTIAPVPSKFKLKIKKGRPSANEIIYKDYCENLLINDTACTKITLTGVFSGLNGSKGLMRHWVQSYSVKKKIIERIKALKGIGFKGQIQVVYTRFSSQLMDWDNLGSTAKFPMDALIAAGIIEDDSPKFITEFTMKQEKCRKKDQRIEILIQQKL